MHAFQFQRSSAGRVCKAGYDEDSCSSGQPLADHGVPHFTMRADGLTPQKRAQNSFNIP